MFLTTGQAAQTLGVSIPTIKKLLAAGAVPGAAQHGRQVFPLAAAQAMAQLPAAPLSVLPVSEVAVLRAGVAEPVAEADRQWIGYSTSLTPQQLLDALRGWWRCDPVRVAAGQILPVTLAGFVVAVLTNLDESSSDGARFPRHAFTHARLAGYITDLANPVNVIEPDADDVLGQQYAHRLLGTRLSADSGGPIAYVPAGPNAKDTA